MKNRQTTQTSFCHGFAKQGIAAKDKIKKLTP
jgi:hypothetical protein